jgi:hypothetical protein
MPPFSQQNEQPSLTSNLYFLCADRRESIKPIRIWIYLSICHGIIFCVQWFEVRDGCSFCWENGGIVYRHCLNFPFILFVTLVSLYAAMSELVDISANESKLYDFLYHQNNSLIHVDLNLVMDALV